MIDIFDLQKNLAKHAGPGGWNDPDMLEVGNGGMTLNEYKTHFSLWCMLASPLMAGNDLRDMSKETLAILTNDEMIAVNQDTLGKQAFCFRDNGDYEIWVKKLAKDEKAVCLLNRSDEVKTVEVNVPVLLKASEEYWTTDPYQMSDYSLRDLWEHKVVKIDSNFLTITILPHSVKVFRFIKQ
jgi:alpha-galactosidase